MTLVCLSDVPHHPLYVKCYELNYMFGHHVICRGVWMHPIICYMIWYVMFLGSWWITVLYMTSCKAIHSIIIVGTLWSPRVYWPRKCIGQFLRSICVEYRLQTIPGMWRHGKSAYVKTLDIINEWPHPLRVIHISLYKVVDFPTTDSQFLQHWIWL